MSATDEATSGADGAAGGGGGLYVGGGAGGELEVGGGGGAGILDVGGGGRGGVLDEGGGGGCGGGGSVALTASPGGVDARARSSMSKNFAIRNCFVSSDICVNIFTSLFPGKILAISYSTGQFKHWQCDMKFNEIVSSCQASLASFNLIMALTKVSEDCKRAKITASNYS